MSQLPELPTYELARIEDECARAGVLDEYRRMVAGGTFPRAAAMYALQSAPGSRNTDRAFCQGARQRMENMLPMNAKAIHAQAKAAGIDSCGKYYVGGLGRYTDKAAWVTCAEDVMTVAKARNFDVDGVLRRKAIRKDPAPPPDVSLAPDIVQRLAADYIASDPALAERCAKSKHARLELREKIIEKHGRPKRVKKAKRLL